ncbi:RNA polymerase sigma factor [Streptomyces sp. NBC_00566]|uniref:RNA polymerase sigma factor n=1 Tax=Streptomyces sp. NBC_00566 TaxID=2975778 RepID=UPI002E80CB67|nr:sigma-70 family RNA polymerase sigma factor [Streptomyces sp. NBC_00566]WUB90303.1 sigma-70 family RNA polymerase sigma factor [Streptomyces sp. NBC_00566]
MTGRLPDGIDDRAIPDPIEDMPPTFWAFRERYHRAYCEYACVLLGDRDDADRLVDRLFVILAAIWHRTAAQAKLGWTLLKECVAAELETQGREPAVPQALASERATRAACEPLLDNFRAQFRAQIDQCENGLGSYVALARLPKRQFDVVVLRFVLGNSTRVTALVMGISEATVRSTLRTAKRRLAADLGLEIGGKSGN